MLQIKKSTLETNFKHTTSEKKKKKKLQQEKSANLITYRCSVGTRLWWLQLNCADIHKWSYRKETFIYILKTKSDFSKIFPKIKHCFSQKLARAGRKSHDRTHAHNRRRRKNNCYIIWQINDYRWFQTYVGDMLNKPSCMSVFMYVWFTPPFFPHQHA